MRFFSRHPQQLPEWELTATVITEQGVWTKTYSSANGLQSPAFAQGFLCGLAEAHGIEPWQLNFDLKVK